MSRYNDSSFSNPITKSGRVVYNVCMDMDHARYRQKAAEGRFRAVDNVSQRVSADILTIQPHEICLQQDESMFRRGYQKSINDTEIQLLSCLNGLKTKSSNLTGKTSSDEKRLAVRKTLKFGGVASTRSIYDASKESYGRPIANDAMFVSQFGGLCTIMNTGDEEIKAGHWIVWDLPKHPEEGLNLIGLKEKQMVITRPYRAYGHDMKSIKLRLATDPVLIGVMGRLRNDGATGNSDQQASLLITLNDYLLEERSRVIGRALQTAKTGETLDLLLGRYIA
jgi:hypothetical protein